MTTQMTTQQLHDQLKYLNTDQLNEMKDLIELVLASRRIQVDKKPASAACQVFLCFSH